MHWRCPVAQFTRLNGPLPVQPPAGGVIRARKKSRPEDRNRENKKKSPKETNEKQVQESSSDRTEETDNQNVYDEPVEYGPSKSKKKYSKKIDLII